MADEQKPEKKKELKPLAEVSMNIAGYKVDGSAIEKELAAEGYEIIHKRGPEEIVSCQVIYDPNSGQVQFNRTAAGTDLLFLGMLAQAARIIHREAESIAIKAQIEVMRLKAQQRDGAIKPPSQQELDALNGRKTAEFLAKTGKA